MTVDMHNNGIRTRARFDDLDLDLDLENLFLDRKGSPFLLIVRLTTFASLCTRFKVRAWAIVEATSTMRSVGAMMGVWGFKTAARTT